MPSANNPPGGAVTLTGTATQYEVLQAASTLTDADGLGPLAWQWQRLVGSTWTDIAGATDSAYTLAQADVGLQLRAIASYTDGGGAAEAVPSTATATVQNIEDAPSGEVVITGSAALQGTVLTASHTLSDLDGLGTVSFNWQRDQGGGAWSNISGATSAAYTPVQADVGHALRAVATYLDQQGTAEAVPSSPTPPIGNVNDAPAGGLTLPGTARQGLALTVNSTVTDADGMGVSTWRWQRDDGVAGWHDIAGATSVSFTPGQAEVGHAVRAVLSYTDLFGTDESLVSPASPPVANANDAPTGTAVVSGVAAQGQTLAASNTLDDADGMGDVTYLWQRSNGSGGWTSIPFANGTAYTPGQADVQHTLRVVASYVDDYGTGESVASAATATVANTNDLPSGSVTLSGTPEQNQMLTASNTLADTDGLGAITYAWQRYLAGSWTTIPGAAGNRYTQVQADVNRYLRAVASYVDGYGTPESVASDATDFVANVNDPATGTLLVAGSAVQDQVLTASISVADPDGLPAWTPQWQRLDGLAGWLDIAGATGATYQLAQADVGTRVRVAVAFTDLLDGDEFLSSAPGAVVANVNDPPTGQVTITGTPVLGQQLTASNSLDDADGRGDVAYEWQRGITSGGWGAIPGATDATYTPTVADQDQPIRVLGRYTDLQGANETVASASAGLIAATVDDLGNDPERDVRFTNASAGQSGYAVSDTYSGPVSYLQHQYIWASAENVAIAAARPNAFLKGGAGGDALLVSGGQNVLDGGTGSNFLIGGTGADGGTDTFFVDERTGAVTWSTIVNFHAGDYATIFGFHPGLSTRPLTDSDGAPGYTGATIHSEINGAGTGVLGSMTFAGIDRATADAHFQYTTGTLPGSIDYLLIQYV